MPSDVLKLTTEIVISHASMTELTPEQLVNEIKERLQCAGIFGRWGILEETRLLKRARNWMVQEATDPFERYRQGQIRGLSGVREKAENLKDPSAQGPWLNAERIFPEIWPGSQKVPIGLQGIFRGSEQDGKKKGIGSEGNK